MIERLFFRQDPLTCSRELVGCMLLWGECAGMIVETEAYSVKNDEACHTFMRPSTRQYVASHQPGAVYVYLNYGMYWLLNVLVKGGTEDGFVLIRAVEPTRGIALMEERRKQRKLTALCSGPGKLCQAFGITGDDNGRDICGEEGIGFLPRTRDVEVATDLRIGITRSADLPWRFLIPDNPHISVPVGGATAKKRRAKSR